MNSRCHAASLPMRIRSSLNRRSIWVLALPEAFPIGVNERVLAVDAADGLLDAALESLEEAIFMEQVADEESAGLGASGGNDLSGKPLVGLVAALLRLRGIQILDIIADDELRAVRSVPDAAHACLRGCRRDACTGRLGTMEDEFIHLRALQMVRSLRRSSLRSIFFFILQVFEVLPRMRLGVPEGGQKKDMKNQEEEGAIRAPRETSEAGWRSPAAAGSTAASPSHARRTVRREGIHIRQKCEMAARHQKRSAPGEYSGRSLVPRTRE